MYVGKGIIDVTTSIISNENAGFVRFSIKIEVKDGKYRYTFTDFWHEPGSSVIVTPGDLKLAKPGGGLVTMGKKNWNGIKAQTNTAILLLIESLESSMTSIEEHDEDW